jgi:hypothetical protein
LILPICNHGGAKLLHHHHRAQAGGASHPIQRRAIRGGNRDQLGEKSFRNFFPIINAKLNNFLTTSKRNF